MTPALLPWVVLAGGAGAVARFLLTRAFARWGVAATALVNLSGAFGAGLAVGAGGGRPSSAVATVLVVGFLGAYTTFSTWMVEVVRLWRDGRRPAATLHLIGTLAAGLLLAYLGSSL